MLRRKIRQCRGRGCNLGKVTEESLMEEVTSRKHPRPGREGPREEPSGQRPQRMLRPRVGGAPGLFEKEQRHGVAARKQAGDALE